MVEQLVAGRLDVPSFEARYYPLYHDEVPDDALTRREDEFFGLVAERLDWSAVAPDTESRGYGWQSHDEYRRWVAGALAEFRQGTAITYPHAG
jgi:hypothetical protein